MVKKFKINGLEFKVTSTEVDENSQSLGTFSSIDQEITVVKKFGKKDITPQLQENVFYHELAHCLLWCAGGNFEDELLVQSLGNMLQQYDQSKK